jgi:hypothetical protein
VPTPTPIVPTPSPVVDICKPDGHTIEDATVEEANADGTVTDLGTIFSIDGDSTFAFNLAEDFPIPSAEPISTFVKKNGKLIAVINLSMLPKDGEQPVIYYKCNTGDNESCDGNCYKGNVVRDEGGDYSVILTDA